MKNDVAVARSSGGAECSLVIVDEMHAQYCLAVQMCLAGHYYPCEVAWIHLDSKGGFGVSIFSQMGIVKLFGVVYRAWVQEVISLPIASSIP